MQGGSAFFSCFFEDHVVLGQSVMGEVSLWNRLWGNGSDGAGR